MTVGTMVTDILEVKMERIGDDLKIIVPQAFCRQLGFEHGDTLLVTVEEERVVMKKKHKKTSK